MDPIDTSTMLIVAILIVLYTIIMKVHSCDFAIVTTIRNVDDIYSL